MLAAAMGVWSMMHKPCNLLLSRVHACRRHADLLPTFNVQDLTDEAKEEAAKGGGGIPTGMYN
jgi:hypothetical protein